MKIPLILFKTQGRAFTNLRIGEGAALCFVFIKIE